VSCAGQEQSWCILKAVLEETAMHQSRKEQGIERISRRLLHPDRREAKVMAELEDDIEAAEEWAGFPRHPRRDNP
jgi:hypothetical protein